MKEKPSSKHHSSASIKALPKSKDCPERSAVFHDSYVTRARRLERGTTKGK